MLKTELLNQKSRDLLERHCQQLVLELADWKQAFSVSTWSISCEVVKEGAQLLFISWVSEQILIVCWSHYWALEVEEHSAMQHSFFEINHSLQLTVSWQEQILIDHLESADILLTLKYLSNESERVYRLRVSWQYQRHLHSYHQIQQFLLAQIHHPHLDTSSNVASLEFHQNWTLQDCHLLLQSTLAICGLVLHHSINEISYYKCFCV